MYRNSFDVCVDNSLDAVSYPSVGFLVVVIKGDTPLQLITLYIPPPSDKNGLSQSQFIEDMESLLAGLTLQPGRLLMVGTSTFIMMNPAIITRGLDAPLLGCISPPEMCI